MPVSDMLAAAALRQLVAFTAPRRPRPVTSVSLVEGMPELAAIEEGAFVIATGAAFSQPTGYLLDTAVRRAGGRGAAALAFRLADKGIPATATGIADRAGLTLVGIAPGVDLGGLCAIIGRELDGGAAAALSRTSEFVELLNSVTDPSPESLAGMAGQALGVRVRLVERSAVVAGAHAAEVVVDGRPSAVMTAAADTDDRAARLVLRLAAEIAGRAVERERRRSQAPIRSAGLLMAELLTAPAPRAMALADRARALEIPVDGWHVAVRLAPIDAAAVTKDDELAALELYDELATVGLHAARLHGGLWHLARLDDELILVHMRRMQPTKETVGLDVTAAQAVISAARARLIGLDLRCGIGRAHPGVAGMRASAAEARAAMAAAPPNAALAFDVVGLRRMLAEWYASETARDAIRELLAPLDALGPRRAATAVATLRTYLDHQGSLTATAKALHLHRNAVRYRVKRAFELLTIDPNDADQRLALHLACRARDLR